MIENSPAADEQEISNKVKQQLNSIQIDHYIKKRPDGDYLVFEVASPHNRFFRILQNVQDSLSDLNQFKERTTVLKRQSASQNRLSLPEANLLRATISGSLTVGQYSFDDDFFSRYTPSVFGYENEIISSGNHIVYGRRGSGKSSLLAYAMHLLREKELPYSWIDMQTYIRRDDIQVSIDVFINVLNKLSEYSSEKGEVSSLVDILNRMTGLSDSKAERDFNRLIPRIRRFITYLSDLTHSEVTIFIDDIHVLNTDYQPKLLSHLYAVSRGNRCNLKVSGIEQLSRRFNTTTNEGMQTTDDARILKLDYNLTMPDKSKDHIVSILDKHAQYCGLPSVGYLSGNGVLSRLVWVAAAVPRDALNLFVQAMIRANSKDQKLVSITSINSAASEMAEQKLQDIERDVSGEMDKINLILDKVKRFCINERRKNAFLVEIKNNDAIYNTIQELIALRLIHVLHEGITPNRAGQRYQALMLDYGFYVGIRAARSVDLFQKEPKTPSYQELRKLPIFRGDSSSE